MNPPELNLASAWRQYYGDVRTYKEWYVKYEQLKPLIDPILQADSEVLDLGCGTSRLCMQLNENGFRRVTAIDYDTEVIEFMRRGAVATEYLVQDARKMQFPDALFDFVFAKATLDFMLQNVTEAVQIISEAWRVLRVNGCFLLLSQAPPEVFDKLLQVVVWNTVYVTSLPLNIGCLSNASGQGTVLAFMCFK